MNIPLLFELNLSYWKVGSLVKTNSSLICLAAGRFCFFLRNYFIGHFHHGAQQFLWIF